MTTLRRIAFVGDPGTRGAHAAGDLARRAFATLSYIDEGAAAGSDLTGGHGRSAPGAVATLEVPVTDEVAAAAREQRTDLLVVGRRWGETASGDMAIRLAREAACPVLVTCDASRALPAQPHLLVAIGDTPDREAIIAAATRVARAFRGRLTLAYVADVSSSGVLDPVDAGWRVLASAVRLIGPHMPVSATVLVGDRAAALLEAAAEVRADIVAIGAPGEQSADADSVGAQLIDAACGSVLLIAGEAAA
jgi:nucleotide-binding universal stress UspA family protein